MFTALLKNVAVDGLGIETAEALKKGQPLTVDGLPCLVRWTRKLPKQQRRLAGLQLLAGPELLAESWMRRLIETLGELSERECRGLAEFPEILPDMLAPALQAALPWVGSNGAAVVAEATAVPELVPQQPPASDLLQLIGEAQRLCAPEAGFLNKALKEFRVFAFQDQASVVERRRVARIPSNLLVQCWLGQEGFEATLLDLTPTGLGLKMQRGLHRGQKLRIECPDFEAQPVQATVNYSRRLGTVFRVGLWVQPGSLEGTWLLAALQKLGFQRGHLERNRQYVRVDAELPVEARNMRGDFVASKFLDLGRGGAMLQSVAAWDDGEHLRLVLGPVGSLPIVYLSATVLQRRTAAAGQWLMRLRFNQMDAQQTQRLNQYILALLQAKGRRL